MTAKPATPLEYIRALPEPRRSEVRTLHALIRKAAPALRPRFVASTIERMKNGVIAYGAASYVRSDGKQVEWYVLALAGNSRSTSLYTSVVVNGRYLTAGFRDALPRAKVGGSYIRFRSLADVDLGVIARFVRAAARRSSGGRRRG
ncbi:MAG: DUF1801 domain-containing protein [Chloroflexi bacterium]|nr:DUF1801 domain-containing protein [Chloroflexota bacterium]